MLVSRYGIPEAYTRGQIDTVAQLLGIRRLPSAVYSVLTDDSRKLNDDTRQKFSDWYLDGQRRFTPKHVLKCFLPVTYAAAGDFQNGSSDVSAGYEALSGGGDGGGSD